jgi:vancomycin resistance protein YoaR
MARRSVPTIALAPDSAYPWIGRLTLITVTIVVLINLIAMLLVAGYQITNDGLIFSGVSVWDTDVSGMTTAQARAALEGKFNYPTESTITFRDGTNIWPISAAELGIHFEVDRTVQAAYEVGRNPNLIESLRQQATAWREGVVISPVIVFDQVSAETYLQKIGTQINHPAVDAVLRLDGAEVVYAPGQIGRELDIPATMIRLGGLVTQLTSGEVPLVIRENTPEVLNADEAAQTASNILQADMEVYIENAGSNDAGPWIASRESLAAMLQIERVPSGDGVTDTYAVSLNKDDLRAFLDPLAPELSSDPVNARFIFNDDTRQLEPIADSSEGRALNVPASVDKIAEMALLGVHKVPLVFDTIAPEISQTATAADLGITELISSATTYFPGSSENRKTNIRTAASRFHGIVIKPWQEFSFNYYLGDVSVDTGFDEALIIYNGRTIKGVGGGVCQVSTTAFQAAFYAGFPIGQRTPHAYRVGYYEHGEGPGMDATVFSPVVNFTFTNDTPSYLLIETYPDLKGGTLTFKFYSTSDGRTVQKDGPYITNIVPHGPPVYEEDPDIPPGTVKQVDYSADGADVRVHRIVYRNGEVLYEDNFVSKYEPWQAVFQVAPGYVPPPPESQGLYY